MDASIRAWLRARSLVREALDKEEKALDYATANAVLPSRLRPATAEDCATIGKVIWYPRHILPEEYAGWVIVEEPAHYGDPFKAFTAHDGSRYGLDGAFVED